MTEDKQGSAIQIGVELHQMKGSAPVGRVSPHANSQQGAKQAKPSSRQASP